MSIIDSLQDFVGDNLSLLTPVNRAWQPTDYLPDLAAEDWVQQVERFRESGNRISDDVLVVLVGNMITEEALPNYSISLDHIVGNPGTFAETPWGQWLRGWSAEENRHGDLLNAYLRLTGRVDMRSVERTIHHLIRNGFCPGHGDNFCAGLIYASFQERATRISHANVAKLALRQGDDNLAKICRKIAADETRHETFYTRVIGQAMIQEPEQAIMAYRSMLKGLVSMPGHNMTDGQDPTMFDRFSAVTQRLGVYTSGDYGEIIAHLNDAWGIATLSVSGKAAKAQDYICRQPERYAMLAGELTERALETPSAPFSWINGRPA